MTSYTTQNIAIAAALRTHGFSLSNIEIDGRLGKFIFDDCDGMSSKAASDIQLGNILVDAITFHNELRRLSGLVRSMTTGYRA